MSIRGRPDFWVLDKREGGREKARTGAEEREEECRTEGQEGGGGETDYAK